MAEELSRDETKALYEQMTNADLQAELGERNLVKTGNKPELVDRLLANDAEQEAAGGTLSINEARAARGLPPVEAPHADEDPVAEDGDLCGACWPDGWPTADTNNASCEHGVWDR